MAILKNKRHEKFALNIFKGMSQQAAYVEAGFKPRGARANSTRLIANDSIWGSKIVSFRKFLVQ